MQQDASGISAVFLERLENVFANGGNEQLHYQGLLQLLDSYWLEAPPRFFPHDLTPNGGVDSAYSLMLMSLLATPLTDQLKTAFLTRYPKSKLFGSAEMQVALRSFTYRIQHDHVRALMLSSNTFVLTTDLAEQVVQQVADGSRRALSSPRRLRRLSASTSSFLSRELPALRRAGGRRVSQTISDDSPVF